MAQELILKTKDEPTFWNKEAAIGLLVAFPVGGIIGGFIGKNRMEKEKKAGKVVSDESSFWNKDTLLGGLIGNVGGAIAGGIIAAVALIGMAYTGQVPTNAMADLVLTAGAGLAGMAGLAGGAYWGGNAGIERQKTEFEEAKSQAVEQQRGLSKHIPDPSQTVETAVEHTKKWEKSISEQQQSNVVVPGR